MLALLPGSHLVGPVRVASLCGTCNPHDVLGLLGSLDSHLLERSSMASGLSNIEGTLVFFALNGSRPQSVHVHHVLRVLTHTLSHEDARKRSLHASKQ